MEPVLTQLYPVECGQAGMAGTCAATSKPKKVSSCAKTLTLGRDVFPVHFSNTTVRCVRSARLAGQEGLTS